ncbi:MAG: RES family NAD+ phosphorylase [bacterium]
MVESQSQIATLDLVDTLQEQAILEQMIEASKPPRALGAENLHYLLATPFRYPPLRWGSRFGGRHEPGIFYGSVEIETVLAESAFYRFVFWQGMSEPPQDQHLITQHDLFSVGYTSDPGLKLQHQPFTDHLNQITNRLDYSASQVLGSAMRSVQVQGFEFPSARCPKAGINIGLFTPHALKDQKPDNQQRWVCETASKVVRFRGEGDLVEFPRRLFLVSGKFPLPL